MTPAFLRELGRVTMNFARLEWNLAFGISGLIGPYTAGGQMVALELSFKRKCLLFDSLCQHELNLSTRKARAECRTLAQRLLACENSLKHVTHPLWLAAPRDRRVGGAIRSRMTAIESKGLRRVRADERPRLKTIADEIGTAADAIIPFVRRHAKDSRRQE